MFFQVGWWNHKFIPLQAIDTAASRVQIFKRQRTCVKRCQHCSLEKTRVCLQNWWEKVWSFCKSTFFLLVHGFLLTFVDVNTHRDAMEVDPCPDVFCWNIPCNCSTNTDFSVLFFAFFLYCYQISAYGYIFCPHWRRRSQGTRNCIVINISSKITFYVINLLCCKNIEKFKAIKKTWRQQFLKASDVRIPDLCSDSNLDRICGTDKLFGQNTRFHGFRH
jgi:hypothetical protein